VSDPFQNLPIYIYGFRRHPIRQGSSDRSPAPFTPKEIDLKAPRAENSIPYHYYIPLYHANHTRVSHKNGSRLRGIRQDRRKEKRVSIIASVYFFSVWLFLFSHRFPLCRIPKKKAKKIKESFENPLPNR
jgi:hypothetical protein